MSKKASDILSSAGYARGGPVVREGRYFHGPDKVATHKADKAGYINDEAFRVNDAFHAEKGDALLRRSGYAAGGKVNYLGPYKGATRKADKAGYADDIGGYIPKPKRNSSATKLRGSQNAKGGAVKKG